MMSEIASGQITVARVQDGEIPEEELEKIETASENAKEAKEGLLTKADMKLTNVSADIIGDKVISSNTFIDTIKNISGASIFYQIESDKPVGAKTGDIWYVLNGDGSTAYIRRYDGSKWTDVSLDHTVLIEDCITSRELDSGSVKTNHLDVGDYMSFHDNGVIVLGSNQSDFKLAVSANGIDFYYKADNKEIVDGLSMDKRVAYINSDQLQINKALVVSGVQVGDYIWAPCHVTTDETEFDTFELKYTLL
jgi:hypothetical protein